MKRGVRYMVNMKKVCIAVLCGLFCLGLLYGLGKGLDHRIDRTEKLELSQVEVEKNVETVTEKGIQGKGQEKEDTDFEQNESTLDENEENPIQLTDFEVQGEIVKIAKLMDVEQVEIITRLRDWMNKNGFSGAQGVCFFNEVKINLLDEKYSVDLQVLIGESGNGLTKDGQMPIVSMDYYAKKGAFEFF